MKSNLMYPVVLCAIFSLSACGTFSTPGQERKLREEIAQLESKIVNIEDEISKNTVEIADGTHAIDSRVRYRPVVAWADRFSNGDAASRVISFRQTSRSGDIDSVSHRCRWNFQRHGYWARIHESDSSRASALIRKFTLVPVADGLKLTSVVAFDLRTQIEGRYRPPCSPWLPTTNIGLTGSAEPTAEFKLTFDGASNGALKYRLDMVAPVEIGIEVRAHFPGFRVGFTLPLQNLTRNLAAGSVSLMVSNGGELTLPDGQTAKYRLTTVNPTLRTNEKGVQLASDLKIDIER